MDVQVRTLPAPVSRMPDELPLVMRKGSICAPQSDMAGIPSCGCRWCAGMGQEAVWQGGNE